MPEEDNKILKYNQGETCMKLPFIIYADLEPLLEKLKNCHNNPEKLSLNKINKHTIWLFIVYALFISHNRK